MPLIAHITPEPRPDLWWRKPDALRAFAYAVLALGDPPTAEEVHGSAAPRPFAVHLLPGSEPPCVRLAALDVRTERALVAAVGSFAAGARVPLGTSDVGLKDATLDEPASYADLAARTFRPVVSLHFATPTTFSQGGDRHLPLPVPDLMLRSWARRWNAFCPEALRFAEEDLDRIAARVGLAGADVRTATVAVGKGKVIGFTGAIRLEALRRREWSVLERAQFAALTAYSAFAGTGARTSQGMGLTVASDRRS